jgi:CCR4-NOT transcription complex subunit 2
MPPKAYSAVGDEWGLLGLPPCIVDAQSADPRRVLISGFDLNVLGLPLNHSEELHPTFSSPWTEMAPKVQVELRLPQSYSVSPPPLKFSMFQKFQLETLFYVFYSMPRDVLQLAAAQELYNRDWRFHKELKMWLTRVTAQTATAPVPEVTKYMAPGATTQTGERGSYYFWDPEKWAKERRDGFLLLYEHLEEKTAGPTQPAPPAGPPSAPTQGGLANGP